MLRKDELDTVEARANTPMIRDARSGHGPLSRLSREDVASIVATNAPYGQKERDDYFRFLREVADGWHPVR